MQVTALDGTTTDLSWWDRLRQEDSRIAIRSESGLELLLAELPSEQMAEFVFSELNARIRVGATHFDLLGFVARLRSDEPLEAEG